jgi:hypothetical protein
MALQVPAMRTYFKYVYPSYGILLPLLLAIAFCASLYLLRSRRAGTIGDKLLGSKWTGCGLIALLVAVNVVVYPIADSLKYQRRGSDQDDILIQAAAQLERGHNPYEGSTYLHNPFSPGPGWILAVFPFSASGCYSLLTPAFVLLLWFCLRALTGSNVAANKAVALLATSPIFWELMVVGSDLIAVACLIVGTLTLVSLRWGRGVFWDSLTIIAGVVLCTSRAVFLFLPIATATLFVVRRRTRAAVYTSVGIACSLGIHAIFYFWNHEQVQSITGMRYPPLHLFGKGNRLVPNSLKVACVCLLIGAFLYAVETYSSDVRRWLYLTWLLLVIPLGFVSAGDLIFVDSWCWACWEGANYLVLPMTVYVAYVCCDFATEENLAGSVDSPKRC